MFCVWSSLLNVMKQGIEHPFSLSRFTGDDVFEGLAFAHDF